MKMDATSMNAYIQSQYASAATAAAESATKSVSGISSTSSREEIEEAVKDFETYMMEQVIKEMKKSLTMEEEDDSNISMYKDLYMDSAISEIASQLVDQIGGDITDDFVDQIMRNYGITGTTGAQVENQSVDNDVVSENIAQANASTVTSVQA